MYACVSRTEGGKLSGNARVYVLGELELHDVRACVRGREHVCERDQPV
jgi:hypothetical protein